MAKKSINGIPVEALLKPYTYDPSRVQRIPGRQARPPQPLHIVDADPLWPAHFQSLKARILAAFESTPPAAAATSDNTNTSNKVTILSINHVGSTSIPSLPAKPIIDIDLVLSPSSSLAFEPSYVPLLEACGFEFRLREPGWHEHRYFALTASASERSEPSEPRDPSSPSSPSLPPEPIAANLHVWPPQSPEVERHRIFRDWLRREGEEGAARDRELYAEVKREAARVAAEKGEVVMEYNRRKEWVVREILGRAFEMEGVLGGEGGGGGDEGD